MRMHVELDGALRCRQHVLRQAAGVLRDGGHEWGDDPAAWVQRQRSGDPRRVG